MPAAAKSKPLTGTGSVDEEAVVWLAEVEAKGLKVEVLGLAGNEKVEEGGAKENDSDELKSNLGRVEDGTTLTASRALT